MAASLFSVGFEVWDVTMQDLLNKQVTANDFHGIIFPGGFSYAGEFKDKFQYCRLQQIWSSLSFMEFEGVSL
jgi:phosphoribosylformylglycinamidine (FGAM) synthase-like amidotransferase family enzyme